ncbi:MAG: adenosylmethionine--8-amino-7-oxononanoate transaminase [Pseudomonadales bacterium]|nr:adenosylmethionine--8-amino-7-oxononanoate transaminase [Pseudomonadales bacterium]
MSTEELLQYDRQHAWHPYASMIDAPTVYPVMSASGVRLTMADGKELIDGMSSWWAAIHGYNHPVLNQALTKQLKDMAHVMFGGLTHPSAVELVRLLVEITPEPLTKVFISDSGSVAVEVAIKMAIQYWYSKGQPQKHKLATIRTGYHGDTFGAMAVCDPETGMHQMFRGVLPQHHFADTPQIGFDEEWDESDISSLKSIIEQHHQELAAVIIEPIVQGAGGMRFYSPTYVKRVRELCDQYDVLLILDEIATGFGRSGELFACEHADICPDIMCVGKAITGGYMSLAATLCNEKISDGICQGEAGAFMHGPTFMGNPLACAVAVASIKLLLSTPWKNRVQRIEQQLNESLKPCADMPQVEDVRVLGSIGVVEMKQPVNMERIQKMLVEKGVWLRPFGKLVYTMPPYIMEPDDLKTLTGAMVETIGAL